jgi:hypothetical protein
MTVSSLDASCHNKEGRLPESQPDQAQEWDGGPDAGDSLTQDNRFRRHPAGGGLLGRRHFIHTGDPAVPAQVQRQARCQRRHLNLFQARQGPTELVRGKEGADSAGPFLRLRDGAL